MDSNASSFFDLEETSQTRSQLNSTAVDQEKENRQEKEWKLSPIVSDNNRQPLFKKRQIHVSMHGSTSLKHDFKSPRRNTSAKIDEVSGYVTKSSLDESAMDIEQGSSSNQLSLKSPSVSFRSADLSSFVANKSIHPFDSLVLNSLHKSISFSPRVIFSSQTEKTKKDGENFQWSLEQLAILKPAHISDDEIAANYHSPIPEVEEKIQEALNEYWTKNVSYIPSPDGPRYVHLPSRDGNMTTIMYGSETSSSTTNPCSDSKAKDATPSLCKTIRKKEAVKAAYATSSPKLRPRRNFRKMRNRVAQTDVTIPPSLDLDLKKVLGEAFIYESDDKDTSEEVFNTSVSSNVSMRRRLFSANEEDDSVNVSMLSCENLNDSQRFNDSLSPVRRVEENEKEEEETSSSNNHTSKSHISQIAINISILNDCMIQSMNQHEEEEQENKEEEEEEKNEENRVFHNDNHLTTNEYAFMDQSTSSIETPKREDLDWTPRRLPENNYGPSSRLHEFMFELSPINAGKMMTPKRRNDQ